MGLAAPLLSLSDLELQNRGPLQKEVQAPGSVSPEKDEKYAETGSVAVEENQSFLGPWVASKLAAKRVAAPVQQFVFIPSTVGPKKWIQLRSDPHIGTP